MSNAPLAGLGLIGISWFWKNVLEDDIIIDANALAASGITLVWTGFTLKAFTMVKQLLETPLSCEENYSEPQDECEENDSEPQDECS